MKLPIPASQLLRPGAVLELFVPVTSEPKYKFCAFCCLDEPPIYFLINSEINDYIRQREHLLEQQVVVPSTELDHRLHKESYLDCSKPFDNFTRGQVLDLVAADQACYMGTLSKELLSDVSKVVADSLTIRPIEQAVILAELEGFC